MVLIEKVPLEESSSNLGLNINDAKKAIKLFRRQGKKPYNPKVDLKFGSGVDFLESSNESYFEDAIDFYNK